MENDSENLNQTTGIEPYMFAKPQMYFLFKFLSLPTTIFGV
jgi:hypothetical protein